MGMEGAVARWYASTTAKSMGDFQKLARRMAGDLAPGASVLEVAPGPGYFAVELAKLGDYRVTGLDISATFVQIARANAGAAGVRVDFQRGNASRMPFADMQFDAIVCRAAFKNFTRPVAALEEMYRVLKPGGRALIIDLRRDAAWSSISEAARGMNLGVINSVITKLTFRFMLLKRAYTKAEFLRMAQATSFRGADIREEGIGLDVRLSRLA